MISTSNFLDSFSQIRDKYDHFLFDLDGVVWRESDVINETVDEIKNLWSMGKNVYVLSNNNRISRYDVQDLLKKRCGLEMDLKYIYTSAYINPKYISEHYKHVKNIYLIGKEGLEREFVEQGFKIYGGRSNRNISVIDNFDIDKVHLLEIDPEIQACVCGFDDHVNFYKFCYGQRVIQQTGLFFGTNTDHRASLGDGKYYPATYCFVSFLEVSTDMKPIIVTKPDPRSLEIIMSDHRIVEENRTKILMIGDNLNTDAQFAVNARIDTLVMMTGVTTMEDIQSERFNELREKAQVNNNSLYVLNSF